MKTFFCSLGLTICLISNTLASNNALDLLNSEITTILAPFQNQNTVAKLKFDAAETNSEHATKAILNGLYEKMGSKNKFNVTIDNLSYDYGDGKSPSTVFKGSIGLDLTKFLTREESNKVIPNAIEFLKYIVNDYTEQYGDAISIKGVLTSTSKDAEDNYDGFTALISIKIDLNKLPENLSRELVAITDAIFSITFHLKTKIAIDAYVISNPESLEFQKDNIGLKEILTKLLSRDEETKVWIAGTFMYLDYIASNIVEIDNSSFWKIFPKALIEINKPVH